jgi:branched-chain amino acid transport system permease protein
MKLEGTQKGIVIWIITAIILLILPYIIRSEYYLRVVNQIFLYAILVLSLNLIIGYTGQISFGHAAFYGIGAYTAAILMTRYGFSFWVAMLSGGITACISGIILGIPCLRVRGNYLALVTLGFGEIVKFIMQNWTDFTGGPMGIVGIPYPKLFFLHLKSGIHYYYLIVMLYLLTYITEKRIVNSYIGRACIAIREDETAASMMGVNTTYYKLLMFAVGTFIAGIAGAYWASYLTVVAPLNFTLDESIIMVMMLIVGGIGSLQGSLVGAAIMLTISEAFRPLYEYRFLIIGFLLIAVLFWRPQGVLGKWGR